MNDLFISEKNISLQKKSTTQVNAQCTLEIQLVQCLNLMTLVETDLLGGKEIILLENNYIIHSSCEKYMCNL